MIVTRHRKRRSHGARTFIVFAGLAVLVGALIFPPSQHAIANGPLQPLWSGTATTAGTLARPLSFAGQQQTITDRNREIRELSAQLEQQREAKAEADARAQSLRQQLTAVASQPRPTPVAAPRLTPASSTGLAAAPGASGATADERRLAATWAAMEPEKAAAIVQRLPEGAVTRVLSQMDADSAGAIMNALPAGAAARISRSIAQVPPAAGR